ncbi:MAG TPA: hypothetical protein VJA94_21640 [Candidatus Angelobacter sp.]
MAIPQLTAQEQAEVAGLVAIYISSQRQAFRRQGIPLSAVQIAAMSAFFSPGLLDAARLLVLTDTRVQNPHFYPQLAARGFTNLPDFQQMAAITFNDVVVAHGPFSDGLLFHELVHVEQYRQLGVDHFAELYVRGFLTGDGYGGIPLEINAYELGDRFERNPDSKFSIQQEVATWIREDRF